MKDTQSKLHDHDRELGSDTLRADRSLDLEVIAGRNAVLEALKGGRTLESINITKGEHKGSILQIIGMAKDRGIPIKEVSPVKLEAISGGSSHQGVAAIASAHEYAELEDIFRLAQERDEKPFFIICDELEDPHNLGAVIRTAEAAGAHGVIIPKRRSAGLTPAVYKASAGAAEYVPVVRAANLANVIEQLKKKAYGFMPRIWAAKTGVRLIIPGRWPW